MRGGFMYLTAILDCPAEVGQVFAESAWLECVQRTGHVQLPFGCGDGAGARRQGCGDREQRPGVPVHLGGVDRGGWRPWCTGKHGRQGPLAGQCYRGEVLVVAEARGCLFASVRDGV